MAEKIPAGNPAGVPPEKAQDHGCFDFLARKDEKKADDVVMTDLNAAKEGAKEEKRKLLDNLQRTHSQSSCSSDEEGGEGGERKKKKGLKDEIMDKLSGKKEGEDSAPIEEGNAGTEQGPEEKKGFLEKVKEKLPRLHKKGDEETPIPPPAAEHSLGCENKEKKGIIDKIKEKLPGHHKTNGDEVEK